MLEQSGHTKAHSEGFQTVFESDLESLQKRPKSSSQENYKKLFEIVKDCSHSKLQQAHSDEIPEFDSLEDSCQIRPSMCTNKSSKQSQEREEKLFEKELLSPQNEDDYKLIAMSDREQCKLPSIIMKNGGCYTGYWYKKKPQGQGEYKFADSSRYNGEWSNGYASGKGKFFDTEGGYYCGDFHLNYMHGKGVYNYSDGSIYDGQWLNDKYNGYGIEVKSDSHYKGQFRNGLKHGHGILVFSNKEKYEGSFINGQFEGKGTFMWPDGRRYQGDWKNGMMHGQGILSWSDGRVYVGQYVNDKRQGFGTFQFADGRKYSGQWMNGLQHGTGEFTEQHGQITKGVWREGKLFSLI
ncbi:unnamed protein product [Paramecium primaurelia]|uniref:MORN repeat protein n=1 Tax=Paramecium primaurelia TaxID=5886 RepID=A0A8S1NM95_PARPR|nr:unnamed protein product [Paramecium primaurelia]